MVYPGIRKRMIGRMEISVKLSEYFFNNYLLLFYFRSVIIKRYIIFHTVIKVEFKRSDHMIPVLLFSALSRMDQ